MADYDPTVCLTDLIDGGLTPPCQTLNPPWHCEDLTTAGGAYHALCAKQGILYQPIPMLYCNNPNTGISQYFPPSQVFAQCNALGAPWVGGTCYCCCSCFANDTLVDTPEGSKQIFLFNKGDPVNTATVVASAGAIQVQWSAGAVNFSAGTSAKGHQPLMMYIAFAGKDTLDLICNMDQPFLLANGKYTKAGKLRPGQQLVDKNGQPVSITMISIGKYEGGVHHIATGTPWTKSPDGHLLLVGGVIAGDYTMQLNFATMPTSLVDDADETLPLIGTPEYDTAHANNVNRSDVMFEFVGSGAENQNTGQRKLSTGLFKTYRTAGSDIPYGAQALFTPAQSMDIAQNGAQSPLSNPIPQSTFNTVAAQLAGFFPDIVFFYDEMELLPNVYAFEAYGKKVVVVTGGLGRMKGFGYEGMFIAMAHGVSCFYGGEPLNSSGLSAVGQADWFACGVVSRLVWVGQPFVNYITNGLQYMKSLFDLVSPEHAAGMPQDPLDDPSLACRYQAMQSAAGGGSLPECAGGAPLPKIAVQNVTASADGEITVRFSLAVENASGSDVANYVLEPEAVISTATLSSTTGLVVTLEAALTPGMRYSLTVQNLVSVLGSGVDLYKDSGTFSAPAESAGRLLGS